MIIAELRAAIRHITSSRSTAIAIVASFAVAIGINAAVFAVVRAVILRPLPYAFQDRLFVAWGSERLDTRRGIDTRQFDARGLAAIEDACAFQLTPQTMNLDAAELAPVVSTLVSRDCLTVLGRAPLAGSGFLLGNDAPPRQAVISESLWRRRFTSDTAILGRTLLLDDSPHVIVGVQPADFAFPDFRTDIWRTAPGGSEEYRQTHVLVRLRAPYTANDGRAELRRVFGTLDPNAPSIALFPISQLMLGQHERALWILFGAVTALLLAACWNASTLLLGLHRHRATEWAVRTCTGATPALHALRTFVEPLMLIVISIGPGLLIARFALAYFERASLDEIPIRGTLAIDSAVVTYSISVAVVSALISAAVPVIVNRQREPYSSLRVGSAGTEDRSTGRWRLLLLALQTSTTIVLVFAASLLVDSFIKNARLDWGFDASNVTVAELSLPPRMSTTREAFVDFNQEFLAGLRTHPAISTASMSYGVPLRWLMWQPAQVMANSKSISVGAWTVGPQYFEALGVSLLDGREFAVSKDLLRREAIVSRRFAQSAWPGERVIGKELSFATLRPDLMQVMRRNPNELSRELLSQLASWVPLGPPIQVIGEVTDVLMLGRNDSPGPMIFLDYRDNAVRMNNREQVIVRMKSGEPQIALSYFFSKAKAIDADVRVDGVFQLADELDRAMGNRGSVWLLALVSIVLAITSMTLAIVGTYASCSLVVNRRRREAAIRLAVGGRRYQIAASMLAPIFIALASGMLIGVALSFGAERLVSSLLPGVSSTGSVAIASLVMVTLAASAVSASRFVLSGLATDIAHLLRAE